MRAAYVAYQAAGWAGLALGWPVLAARALWDPRFRVGWGERLGRWPEGPGPRPVWIHGASVGEMQAAAPLIAAVRARGGRLLLTTTSPSGRDAAARLAAEQGIARLLPLDLAPLARAALKKARPRALVVVETELWPSLLTEARRMGVPTLLVNARISDRSYPRYLRVRRWLSPLLETFAAVQAQSPSDAERFRSLGAPSRRVTVGGNLKYDVALPAPGDSDVCALRRARAGGWRVLIGGSTHPGEEETILAALRAVEERGFRVGMVLAPRHLERLADVEAVIRAAGRSARRWSQLTEPREAGILAAFAAGEVLLLDSYGLLGRLYGAAEVAFVGGSLVAVGGHNLLEPLNWGVPVLFGPHMQNAREIRDEVVGRTLGHEVADASSLSEAIGGYLEDPAKMSAVRAGAAALLEANRGAVRRALAALEEIGAFRDVEGE